MRLNRRAHRWNWHRGHRDSLTYSEFDGPKDRTRRFGVKSNHSLVGIARAVTKALRVSGDNVTLQMRTIVGGSVKIEGFAKNRPQVGRPAYVVAWYLVSPLPRRLQIDEFWDYDSGLPENLEAKSFFNLKHFENDVAQAGLPEGARWIQPRPPTTDHSCRVRLMMKLNKVIMRKRNPIPLSVIQQTASRLAGRA